MSLITISKFQKKHKLDRYWFFNLKCEKPKIVKMELRCVRKVALYDESELEKLLPEKGVVEKKLITLEQYAEKKCLDILEIYAHKDTNIKFPAAIKQDLYDEEDLRRFCRINYIREKGFDNFRAKEFLSRPMPKGLSWQK